MKSGFTGFTFWVDTMADFFGAPAFFGAAFVGAVFFGAALGGLGRPQGAFVFAMWRILEGLRPASTVIFTKTITCVQIALPSWTLVYSLDAFHACRLI